MVRQHQKQHPKWVPSILITTNNIEPVAFDRLVMENRDGKRKCLAPRRATSKFNGNKSPPARVPQCFASRTVPSAHPHDPPVKNMYNLTFTEVFSCFILSFAAKFAAAWREVLLKVQSLSLVEPHKKNLSFVTMVTTTTSLQFPPHFLMRGLVLCFWRPGSREMVTARSVGRLPSLFPGSPFHAHSCDFQGKHMLNGQVTGGECNGVVGVTCASCWVGEGRRLSESEMSTIWLWAVSWTWRPSPIML